MKFDFLPLLDKIPNKKVRNWVLDLALDLIIPFNRNLGFHIEKISIDGVIVDSPDRTRRENHVGGAHACALALLGEYPAGLLVAQRFPPHEFRPIISKLHVDYFKQGRGTLRAEALPPKEWPALVDGEGWVEMTTTIRNEKDETVATCLTKWQVKEWSRVRKKSP